MDIRELDRIIAVRPEPQTTPSLAQAITRTEARETVADYHFTPSLRAHFKRVFDCIVHRKGQGFWVQAEYGAGKTIFWVRSSISSSGVTQTCGTPYEMPRSKATTRRRSPR
jgi:hypothetical protein